MCLTNRWTSASSANASFDAEKRKLEQQMVLFPKNSSVLMADQSIRIDNIEDSLNKMQETADQLGRKVHFVLVRPRRPDGRRD